MTPVVTGVDVGDTTPAVLGFNLAVPGRGQCLWEFDWGGRIERVSRPLKVPSEWLETIRRV